MIRQRILVAAMILIGLCGITTTWAQEQSMPGAPVPTVPEFFTITGQFTRLAYNNEGFATLGYRTAQQSVGQDWILLNAGITLMKGVKDYELKRENITLKIPSGQSIALATRGEFNEAGGCRNLVMRDNRINDSIDYFPSTVGHSCAMRFFGPPGKISYDQVELSYDRACLGRLFFKIPGGIVPGQYWVLIQFANSELQVPFRILTKEEEAYFSKNWEKLKKEHEAALKED
jgi:hypothetical protein